jgi:uncharacterized phage-associated protein
LVSGYFEAWQYGPVHPTVYQAFSAEGARPIRTRAFRTNIATGECAHIDPPGDLLVRRYVARILQSYGHMTPGRLVDIAHAKDGPWDFIANLGRRSVAFGLRIPDHVTVERFKHHKVSIGNSPNIGEPGEDTPLV